MGRPSMHQNRQPSFDMGGAGQGAPPPHMAQHGAQQQQPMAGGAASGGYNFQRIMDDHFEHYKRAPSREQSVDRTNLPGSLAEAPSSRPRGRSGSRPPLLRNAANPAAATDPLQPHQAQQPPALPGGPIHQRAPSGTRAPSVTRSRATSSTRAAGQQALPYTDMDLDLRRAELEAKFSQNGEVAHEDTSLRHRGQPSQEVTGLGTIPKRTESLYVKESLTSKGKVRSSNIETCPLTTGWAKSQVPFFSLKKVAHVLCNFFCFST